MAQLDAKSLGAPSYTDCLPYNNSKLNISAVALSITTSYYATLKINLSFNISNPAAPGSPAIDVADVYWTLNFLTPITGNQTMYRLVIPTGGPYGPWSVSSDSLYQIFTSRWIPFQLVFHSIYSELACWEGSVYVIAPPNPSDCWDNSQLNLSSVSLRTNGYNQSSYLTFKVWNTKNTIVSFNSISWWITYSSGYSFWYDQNFNSPVVLLPGVSIDLIATNVKFTSIVNISWYQYVSRLFLDNWLGIGCWQGYQYIQQSPSNPPGCFNGNTLLSVNNVALHPSTPQVHDSIYLTFEVENESDEDVTFNNIYLTLNFNFTSPITFNLAALNKTVQAGQNLAVTSSKVTLSERVREGTYWYQLALYEDTTDIVCWGGELVVPSTSPSSSSFFLGLAGLSILVIT